MQNPLLTMSWAEIKKLPTNEILPNLDLIYNVPHRLSKVLKILTFRQVKHTKILKAAIYLQRSENLKYKRAAMEYILCTYDTFDKSCTYSEYNVPIHSKPCDFLRYDFSAVKRSLSEETVDENLLNFSKNLKNVFNNRMVTDNKEFVKDVVRILRLYGRKKRINLRYYKDLEIFDERVLIILMKEKRFKRIVQFMLCINSVLKPKSRLACAFVSANSEWKEWQANGFPEYKIEEQEIENICNIKITKNKPKDITFDVDGEKEPFNDGWKDWIIE
ncbi:hypothetical protein THOM_3140 [Trachipleistophora hominis]|uniref:Uncharacterized protein n=1 Tax=Trachipleistophora hominis TaxID=72359 RepID=L7JR78_TRAHO|nr:hypothetical protein THOM_3140 [Trachipleistophora hominis]